MCLSSIIAKPEQDHKRAPVKRIYPHQQQKIILGFAAQSVFNINISTLMQFISDNNRITQFD